MLPSCKKEPDEAQRTTTVPDRPRTVTTSEMNRRIVADAKRELGTFQFGLDYYTDEFVAQPCARVILLAPAAPPPARANGAAPVLVRTTEHQAERIIDWLAADEFFARGTLNSTKSLVRPAAPFFVMSAGFRNSSSCFDIMAAQPRTIHRLRGLLSELDGETRAGVARLIEGGG
jgi:hypothetical protein